jgi:hypothetical protein
VKSSITAVLLVLSINCLADPAWYDWDAERSRVNLPAEDAALPELVLKHHTQYDYNLEGDNFFMYVTTHRIVYVNSNEAVQRHNRIVIHMNGQDEIRALKARTISKSGKVVLFDQSNIKELKDEESGSARRIFAIEGAEVGGEIEYFYTRKTFGSIYRREYFQSSETMRSVSFRLSCPNHLQFDFKTYNGLPPVKKLEDTARNAYSMETARVAALQEEPFSFYDPNRMRVEFKLAYNLARSKARLYTFDDASKNFFKQLTHLSSDDQKAVGRFIKTLPDVSKLSGPAKIKAIEKAIKTTIHVNEDDQSETIDEVASIIKFKIASESGITKVFVAVFDALAIPYQVVITCSREKVKFDGAFDSWSFLEEYLLYFPEHKGFIAPYAYQARYPLVPNEFTEQDGLFVEPVVIGEQRTALGTVRRIPAASFRYDLDDLDISVAFEDNDMNRIRQKRTFTGYGALDFTAFYDMLNDDRKRSVIDELLKQTAPDATIKTWDVRETPLDSTARFVVDTDFTSAHFIERAGNRILFKAGLLIGPQSELYRDEERAVDVENTTNRGYHRTIKVTLPAGYKIRNPETLDFDVAYDKTPDTPFIFKSTHSINGDILEIKIWEGYKTIGCPKDRYEDFRRVINAAADFNKVILVLEKV